jgi:hypothetical protein
MVGSLFFTANSAKSREFTPETLVGLHDNSGRSCLGHCRECSFKFVRTPYLDGLELPVHFPRRCLRLLERERVRWIGRVPNKTHAGNLGQDFFE